MCAERISCRSSSIGQRWNYEWNLLRTKSMVKALKKGEVADRTTTAVCLFWIATSRWSVIAGGALRIWYLRTVLEIGPYMRDTKSLQIGGERYFLTRKRSQSFLATKDARATTCSYQFRLFFDETSARFKVSLFLCFFKEDRSFVTTGWIFCDFL